MLFLLRESVAQVKDIFLLLPKSSEMGQGSLSAPDDPVYRGDMLGHISWIPLQKQESAWDLWHCHRNHHSQPSPCF